jgi:Zn-finger nucleic acid-binding protein
MNVKCPRCGNLLNEIAKAGVLVDLCDRCLGMWLDRGEMEKITARLRELEREWDGRWRESDDRRPGWRDDDDDRYRDPRKKKRWTEMFDIFD